MDALAALADQLGSVNVHLPLTEGMYSYEAIELISNMYLPEYRLDQTHYSESQAYRNKDGKLAIDIKEVGTNNVLMTFVNMTSGLKQQQPFELTATRPVIAFMFAPLKIDIAEELEFLNRLAVGVPLPMFETANTQAYELAKLLNGYNYNGRWLAGTFGELSTCGFELVYLGPSKDAPEGFVIGSSPLVAIIQLHCGSVKGYICLRT